MALPCPAAPRPIDTYTDADADSIECLSSRAHFFGCLCNVSAPVLCSIILMIIRMSQLRPSILLICVGCLSSRAHFRCRFQFLRLSKLACSILLICVECFSSRAHFRCRCQFLRMSQLACSILLIRVECLSSRAHF